MEGLQAPNKAPNDGTGKGHTVTPPAAHACFGARRAPAGPGGPIKKTSDKDLAGEESRYHRQPRYEMVPEKRVAIGATVRPQAPRLLGARSDERQE
jgi:hypothetical protein